MTGGAPRVIYVDVDDTLVRSFGSKRIPIGAMVEQVQVILDDQRVAQWRGLVELHPNEAVSRRAEARRGQAQLFKFRVRTSESHWI